MASGTREGVTVRGSNAGRHKSFIYVFLLFQTLGGAPNLKFNAVSFFLFFFFLEDKAALNSSTFIFCVTKQQNAPLFLSKQTVSIPVGFRMK